MTRPAPRGHGRHFLFDALGTESHRSETGQPIQEHIGSRLWETFRKILVRFLQAFLLFLLFLLLVFFCFFFKKYSDFKILFGILKNEFQEKYNISNIAPNLKKCSSLKKIQKFKNVWEFLKMIVFPKIVQYFFLKSPSSKLVHRSEKCQ